MDKRAVLMIVCVILLAVGSIILVSSTIYLYKYEDEFVKARVFAFRIHRDSFIAEITDKPSKNYAGLVLQRTFASKDSAIAFVEKMREAYYNFTGQKPTKSKVESFIRADD